MDNKESSMSRLTKLTAGAALLAALAAAGWVAAQDRPLGGPGGRPGAEAGPGSGHGFGRGAGAGHGFDFAAVDADGNGSLTAAELQAFAVARVAVIDTDGNGTVSRVELVALVPDRMGPLMNPFGRDRGEVFADRMLARMGATEAGGIVIEDMVARRVSDMLAVFDTDRDGAIAEAEADAGQARMAERREGRGRRAHH
jgi:hypothetical protein